MTPTAYAESICRKASQQKVGLNLSKTPEGHSYEWSNGVVGKTSAHTREVALVLACQHWDQAQQGVGSFNFHFNAQ